MKITNKYSYDDKGQLIREHGTMKMLTTIQPGNIHETTMEIW